MFTCLNAFGFLNLAMLPLSFQDLDSSIEIVGEERREPMRPIVQDPDDLSDQFEHSESEDERTQSKASAVVAKAPPAQPSAQPPTGMPPQPPTQSSTSTQPPASAKPPIPKLTFVVKTKKERVYRPRKGEHLVSRKDFEWLYEKKVC
jgi:hypothetical protein